jgi:uncharacterized protein (TIGR01777 family)
MEILITGGTGLIGSALCAALLREGHGLTVLSRKTQSVPIKCGQGVKAISSLSEWHPDMDFDAVINLAGEPIIDRPWTKARQERLWNSRVTLTEELVGRIAQAKRPPKVLLSGSATGYYGDAGNIAQDESAPSGADFGAQLCAAWEGAAMKALDSHVRVCLLRTGLVLHSDGGLLAKMYLPFKLGLGARIGHGNQWMSWIHIEDYVSIVGRLLVSANASGPYNMTAPEPVTNAVFTANLAKVLHRPALLVAPSCLLRLALGKRADLLLGGQRALPTKVQKLGYRFIYTDLRHALMGLLGC